MWRSGLAGRIAVIVVVATAGLGIASGAAEEGMPTLWGGSPAPTIMRIGPFPDAAYPRVSNGAIDVDDLARVLGARGFRNVRAIRRKGDTLICEATGRRGEELRLVVDARTGELLGARLIGF